MKRARFVPLLAALLTLMPASVPTHAADPAQGGPITAGDTVSAGRLENVRLLTPAGTPKAMVVYFSGRTGWSPGDEASAQALRDDGDMVLAVDFPAYARALDTSDGECLYVAGEITDLAQTAQRKSGIQTYLPPILAGSGEGATLAYAALADAPVNTLGGAVADGFANRLSLRLPLCAGAAATRTADASAWTYGFDRPLPEAGVLLANPETFDGLREQASSRHEITVEALDPENRAAQVAEAVSALAGAVEPFGKLPAIDLPSSPTPRAVAILVSGDGGWRDLDKTIGEWLSRHGVHVVGLDALHYFWSKRTPQELAADIAGLIASANPAGDLPVMLIGYSFGADTVPFAFPLLPKALQDRTKVLALMAPSLSTSFQVTISGWLGIDDSGYDVPAAIASLPARLVMCIFGAQESDSACPLPALKKVTVVETQGGHHFDGDYAALAQRLLDRL